MQSVTDPADSPFTFKGLGGLRDIKLGIQIWRFYFLFSAALIFIEYDDSDVDNDGSIRTLKKIV